MADANPKVMEMVQAELQKNPDISNDELREKAKSLDKGIDRLSARQFNATYPLQVKRAMKPAGKRGARKGRRKAAAGGKRAGGRRRGAAKAGGGRVAASAGGNGGDVGSRDQVRRVLVDLAREVAEGDRGALVAVGASIDRYVDRVMKAAG